MSGKSHSPSAPPPYSVIDPYLPYARHRPPTPPPNRNTASAHAHSFGHASAGVPNPGGNKTSASNTVGSILPKTSAPGSSPIENTTSVTYAPHPHAPALAFHPYMPSPASAFLPYSSYASCPYSAAPYGTPCPYGYAVPSASPYATAPTVIMALPNQTAPAAYPTYQVPGVMMQGEGTMAAPDESFNVDSAASSCQVHGSDYPPCYHPLQGHHPHYHNPGSQ